MSGVREMVEEKYSAIAAAVRAEATAGRCCGDTGCGCGNPITSDLYSEMEAEEVPAAAMTASLGCGNPTALASLEAGQTVLDLGSGGGIDVLLSAKRVGPTGRVYGLDMTDEMLALARDNRRKAGVTNVEFLKGAIEKIPLPDHSVDVVISNCVINLSDDKDAALREAFRVLKPGGRFAVSDVVAQAPVPPEIRRSAEHWTGCVAGALRPAEYTAKLTAAGFEAVSIDVWRTYDLEDAPDVFASAFVRATKPAVSACCAPGCCS